MKSSLHSLISFLPLFCNFQLNSIPLLPSSYSGRLASRNSTQFFSIELFFITILHASRRKLSLSFAVKACLQRRCIATKLFDCCLSIRCRWNVFNKPLPSNERRFWPYYHGFRASCHNTCSQSAWLKLDSWWIKGHLSRSFSEFLLFSRTNRHFTIAPFPFITPPEMRVSSDQAAHYHVLVTG
jgi:hypothetical protein